MSKHGWTYKKLGDVAEIVGGSTPKTSNPDFWGGEHYWVTPAELGDFVYINKTERTITDDALAKTNLTLLPVGTVLLSSRAPIGKTAITTVPMYCNQGFKNIICSKVLNNKFVYYYINRIVPKLQSLGRGATFKEISKSIVESTTIPVPGMAEQEAIVAELDEINEAIAALQQQVADLDTLAQATFYDMFGDPVINPKAWPVKKLGELSTVKTGPFGSMLHKEDYIGNGIPLVNPIHMRNFKIVPDMSFTIPEQKAHELSNYLLKSNDVVFARRGDIGRCAVVSKEQEGFLCGTGSLFVRFNENVDSVFTMYVIRSESFTNSLLSAAKGATMLNINSTVVENLNFILPPLSLQQEFAEKVEAIEAAKAELNAQIAEMQTLLASRMDYYFD